MRHGFFSTLLGILCLCSLSTPSLAQSANPIKFRDLAGDPYAQEIEQAAQDGLVAGFGDQTFRPQASLTREQLLSIVVDALFKVPLQNPNETQTAPVLPTLPSTLTTNPFPDVDRTRWSATKITYAKTLGLIRGYEDGTFRPTQPVTRAELIVLLRSVDSYLVKLRNWDGRQFFPSPAALNFSDIQTHWARPLIENMSTNCRPEQRVASFLNETGTRFAPNAIAQRNYAAAATVRAVSCLSIPPRPPA